jgi:hypothetical protein
MGATCAHSSMAQYCSRFTVGRVGGLGARLGSESRGKGGSAHWTVRSPKSAPYTRRKQYIRLKPVLARPSCDASGKRLRSQRALLQLLATTFHDSAAGEGFAGSLRRFVSSPPSTTPLVWQCSNVVVAASAASSGKHHECGGSMRGVCHSPPREAISPTLPINLFVFSLCCATMIVVFV